MNVTVRWNIVEVSVPSKVNRTARVNWRGFLFASLNGSSDGRFWLSVMKFFWNFRRVVVVTFGIVSFDNSGLTGRAMLLDTSSHRSAGAHFTLIKRLLNAVRSSLSGGCRLH